MTCGLLYISESSLSKNEYWNFISSVNAIHSYLKAQTNITTEWLAQTENNGQLILYIEDNGEPIKYGNQIPDEKRKQLIKKVDTTSENEYQLNIHDVDTSKVVSKQIEFTIFANNTEYYASAAFIPKAEGFLGVISIYSLERYHRNIYIQRLIYLGIDASAIIFLWFFSYFFTKRIIRPVEESRKKQVEFIALASHELRSPLTVITSSMSAMKKADETQSERFENIINSEVKRMSRLINDMLSLASADNSSWSLQMENTDMDTLLLDTFEAFQPIAMKKNIHLSFSFPDEPLPTCKCDKQRVEQVLSILIDNALSYTKNGGKVNLSVKRKLHKLEIYVADNGIGISDENKKHIFHRFYRVDSSHKSKDHFGLGLCIANEIVKLHKGTLTVSDTSGGGATFTITLNI